MEKLMQEIIEYAESRGIKPATVLQYSTELGGSAWKKWLAGGHCELPTADKIRQYMADNPAKGGSK